ncbi:DAHL domain-containing protein [Pseudomonas fluorescens]|uniref:histidine kinase n=1 Tax=Pseudomonas fluorescens TaxID=294 RepID=A0A944HI59_PSEFL|nr:DAHL domain-containing protein [Pseudomonas fluorescens]MBT2298711.1 GHKL domain-containing protein [Pseudomonas fluorescens]MBT2309898.1 GHKL domain-containing protein [Pseudomonas fluorescens]MBT2315453.1 GHKL domain-containing protein [Pseudomonas fluorescens]MBT2315521.1 GHKL domain-containing protein [Pseudomonas fluorescens]MBT2328828.1 GHKL domain-containing protein [Pseudomonas fluorescens]
MTALRRLGLAFVGLLLVSVLLFIYIQSGAQQAASSIESRDLIRLLKQQDAIWDNEVLKSRIALSHNYDPLVSPLNEMARLWQRLDAIESESGRHAPSSWEQERDEYLKAVKEKTRLVEKFKSHNAVLRNSLAFLPTAEDDIQAQFAQLSDTDKLELQSVAIDTYDLLLSAMEFAHLTTREQAAEVLLGLNRLDVNKERLPEGFQKSVDILSRHIALILREQPRVNDLLQGIAAVPVAGRLDTITNLLEKDQEKAAAKHQRNHILLLVFATLLVLILIWLAIRLIRSFAEIKQVNNALQTANDELELRVEERTRQLKDTQSELMDTARQAGMAEIATNVLHNVGNVLNSVNISADLISRKLRSSKALGLGKAMQLINEHPHDLGHFLTEDEKGKLLPGYLNQLVEAIAAEQQGLTDELAQLSKSVDHIKDIVSTQQSYAGANSLVEPLVVSELLEDALRMNSGALTRHHVTVLKEYGDVPRIMGDKHRLLLILINLISNAKYAMAGVSNHARNMTLKATVINDETLQISVKDEGEGIPAENMTRIFAHGFTTRKEGHGFGLHSCALAAIEMNGHLTAHSEGPGTGATFVLQLPLKLAEGEHE